MSAYDFPVFEFLGLLLAGAGALAGVWYRLHQRDETLRHDNAVQFAAVAAVISEFKLEVARNYATNAAIREVENRIVAAIERLGDRFDKFSDNRS